MAMLSANDWMWLVLLVMAVFAIGYGPPVWVSRTQSSSDPHRLKVHYEGIDSAAGPNNKVIAIVRAGTWASGHVLDLARIYEVTIQKFDGSIAAKRVAVQISLFGDGQIFEL
jgi:hypothetical protein